MMKIIKTYRVPLVLSLTLAISLIALNVEKQIISIILIFVGALLGTFILDLDYIIQALYIDIDTAHHGIIKEYIKHKDIPNLLSYISHNKKEFEQRALNSALFQIILLGITLFTVTSTLNVFLKTLVLATFVNSIYRFLEEYLQDRKTDWFWSIKIETKPLNIYLYLLFMLGGLLYSVYLF